MNEGWENEDSYPGILAAQDREDLAEARAEVERLRAENAELRIKNEALETVNARLRTNHDELIETWGIVRAKLAWHEEREKWLADCKLNANTALLVYADSHPQPR